MAGRTILAATGLLALPIVATVLALYGAFLGLRWIALRMLFGGNRAVIDKALWTAR